MRDRVEELFHEAMDLAPRERAAFLRRECGGDVELYAEVQSLLECGSETGAMFDQAIGKLAATLTPSEGSRAGAYRLLQPIGEGGMGVVYLGVRDDGQFDNQVAIKFVQGGEDVLARFRQERQILARLVHPNIARLLDGGITEDGHPFMVMDYFPGKPITEYCLSRYLPVEERLALFRKACEAIEYAHRSLVIHRDVKPSNILVNEQGEVKLLDFGIAKLLEPGPDSMALTMTGMRFFTPDYASPEQIRGDGVTTATDVYSLGAVLYEMLTGRRPHGLEKYTPAEITRAVCEDAVTPPGVTADLDAMVLMALRKEPERRYASVAQFSEDIGRYLEHRPILARPDAARYRMGKFIRRHRLPVAAGAVAVFSLIGGTGVAVWQARIARDEAAEARHRFEQVRKLARTVLFELDPKIRDLTGTTDARELLVKTGLEYLDSLHAAAQSDLSLRRELAAAYEQVGDVQGAPGRPNLGQRKRAVASYGKAAELLDKMPDKTSRDRRALAGVYLKLAEVGGPAGSLTRGAELAKKAVEEMPGVASDAMAARAYRLLGVHSRNRLEYGEAMKNLRTALEYAARWQKGDPKSDQAMLMESLIFITIADTGVHTGHPQEAVDATLQAERIQKKLLEAHPGNAIHQRVLFRAYTLRATALADPDVENLGKAAEAARVLEMAMEIAQEQRKADPRSVLALGDVADTQAALGYMLAPANPRGARAHLEAAAGNYDVLLKTSPANFYFKANVVQIWIALGDVLHRLGEDSGAFEQMRKALSLQREIVAALPGQPGMRHNMMPTLSALAGMHLDVGQVAEAENVLEEARQIADSVARDGSYASRVWRRLVVYQMLGRLHVVKRSGQAADWYRKSLGHLEELEKAEGPSAKLTARRAEIEKAMSGVGASGRSPVSSQRQTAAH
ncbi:MAG: protein kinase [Bryobacterales bacterium]|nr:protein kinase [Bryobacterales bacterium]